MALRVLKQKLSCPYMHRPWHTESAQRMAINGGDKQGIHGMGVCVEGKGPQ